MRFTTIFIDNEDEEILMLEDYLYNPTESTGVTIKDIEYNITEVEDTIDKSSITRYVYIDEAE